jgi:hypothetical protein
MSETRPNADAQTPAAPATSVVAACDAPATEPSAAPAMPRPAARKLWRIRWGLLSPRGMLLRAGLLVVIYALFHVLGWREHVSAVYATSSARPVAAVAGILYALSYFALVLLAPILAVAAGILAVLQRVLARRE